jgi:hypothetical protein
MPMPTSSTVVIVNVQIALGADGYIQERMARELLQHVVEKADSGGDFAIARSVEVNFDLDLGLVRFAGNSALAHGEPLNCPEIGRRSSKPSANWRSAAKNVCARDRLFRSNPSTSQTSLTISGDERARPAQKYNIHTPKGYLIDISFLPKNRHRRKLCTVAEPYSAMSA